MSYDQLVRDIIDFRDARNWRKFHNSKNLAEGICIESAELLSIFLWKDIKQSDNLGAEDKQKLEEEVADIFIFLNYICNNYNIDLLEATRNKIRINKERYPVDKAYGNSTKYDKL